MRHKELILLAIATIWLPLAGGQAASPDSPELQWIDRQGHPVDAAGPERVLEIKGELRAISPVRIKDLSEGPPTRDTGPAKTGKLLRHTLPGNTSTSAELPSWVAAKGSRSYIVLNLGLVSMDGELGPAYFDIAGAKLGLVPIDRDAPGDFRLIALAPEGEVTETNIVLELSSNLEAMTPRLALELDQASRGWKLSGFGREIASGRLLSAAGKPSLTVSSEHESIMPVVRELELWKEKPEARRREEAGPGNPGALRERQMRALLSSKLPQQARVEVERRLREEFPEDPEKADAAPTE